jgi:hypothetical protein
MLLLLSLPQASAPLSKLQEKATMLRDQFGIEVRVRDTTDEGA